MKKIFLRSIAVLTMAFVTLFCALGAQAYYLYADITGNSIISSGSFEDSDEISTDEFNNITADGFYVVKAVDEGISGASAHGKVLKRIANSGGTHQFRTINSLVGTAGKRPTGEALEAAKKVAIEFVSGRPDDNIGLTVFAGEAYTQCPMTVDHAALLNMLNGMRVDMAQRGLIEDGTAIGMGIANAITRLKDSKAKSKVIILLTDGTNNRGQISPNTAADIAKTYGIRVYTIGVGTNGTAPYPVSVAGRIEYMNVPVEIDSKTLATIAAKTDGEFYRAQNTEKLREVYQQIDKLEKTKMNVKKFSKKYESFGIFALISVIALMLELLLRKTLLKRIP